jgi:hypothetical protein
MKPAPKDAPRAFLVRKKGDREVKSVHAPMLAFCLAAGSCADSAPKGNPTEKTDGPGRVEWVDPATLQPGPIQRDNLSDEQMSRIRALRATFVDVDGQTVEQWVDNFKRDADPDKELRIWERMAKAYRKYCDGKDLSAGKKKEVYRVVLLRSMASEQDVLQRAKLKELSREDVLDVMKGY